MTEPLKQLEGQFLDLLVDGDNSFAGLYRGLVLGCDYPRGIDIEYLMETLQGMEQAGLVVSTVGYEQIEKKAWSELNAVDKTLILNEYQEWLPSAEFEDMSFDKVGVWFEILKPGRAAWEIWRESIGQPVVHGDWKAHLDGLNRMITVHAPDEQKAREILSQVCSLNNVAPILESIVIEQVEEYAMRDGRILTGGVRLAVKFSAKPFPN